MTTTLISSGDCTLQFGIWLWNRDSEFTKWQHPVMWYVALEWHTIEFAQTSAILEFYIWFPFPHITAVDMSFCTSLRNLIQIGPVGHPRQNKITSCRFSRWRISAILDCRDPIISSLKNQLSLHNFLWVVSRPRHHIALNCLVFEKIAFLHFGVKIQDGGSPPSWILGVPWWFLWKPITHQVTHQVRLHLASCPSSSWLIIRCQFVQPYRTVGLVSPWNSPSDDVFLAPKSSWTNSLMAHQLLSASRSWNRPSYRSSIE